MAAEESATKFKHTIQAIIFCSRERMYTRVFTHAVDSMSCLMGFVFIVTRARNWRSRSLEFCAFLLRFRDVKFHRLVLPFLTHEIAYA